MTNLTSPLQPPLPSPLTKGDVKASSKWPRRLGIGVAIVVALFAGVGIGTAGSSQQSKLNAANATVSRDHGQIGRLNAKAGTLQTTISSLQSSLASETNTANHALATATAKVKASDAARQAQLNGEAATLKSKQNTLDQEIGDVQANSISSDGMYVVGRDIKSGTWHTNGDGGSGNQCYYQTDNSSDLSSISNIGSNANFDGPETVNVSGYYAFEIQGPCTWVLVP